MGRCKNTEDFQAGLRDILHLTCTLVFEVKDIPEMEAEPPSWITTPLQELSLEFSVKANPFKVIGLLAPVAKKAFCRTSKR
jgi:hypothetical protein